MVSLKMIAAAPILLTIMLSLTDHFMKLHSPPPSYKDILADAGVDVEAVEGTAVITGCTSGIGEAITKRLHDDVGLTIICLSRSAKKMSDLKAANGFDNFVGVKCDLSDLSSVKVAVKQVKAILSSRGGKKIDYLINNAGMHYGPGRVRDYSAEERARATTKQGYDQVFAANYLGHFGLTHALIDSITKGTGRVIQVSSSYHWHSDGEMLRRKSEKRDTVLDAPIAAIGRTTNDSDTPRVKDLSYGNSKLAQILHARHLGKLHPEIAVASVCPSWVGTNIVNPKFRIINRLVNFLAFDVDSDGILSTLLGVLHPDVRSGDFLTNTRITTYLPMELLSGEWTSTTALPSLGSGGQSVVGRTTVRDVVTHAFAGFLMLYQRFGFGGLNVVPSSAESYDQELEEDLYEYSVAQVEKWM